jgi:hypothetical protein
MTNRKKNKKSKFFSLTSEGEMYELFDLAKTPWLSNNFSHPLRPEGNATLPKIDVDAMHRAVGAPVFCHAAMLPETLGDKADLGWRSREYRFTPHVVINPILDAIDFKKVIDPFSAFVEIERYLTNELAPKDFKRDMSVVEKSVSDKIKAESHGFDKYSFRKEPAKK